MNAIITSPEIEIIPPGEGVTLILALHPLSIEAETVVAPAGLSLEELVARARTRVRSRIRSRFLVAVERDPVTEEMWGRVRPRPGTTVIIRAVPAGGDTTDLLRAALGLAITAVGAFVSTIPGIGPLLGAGITLAGQYLVNALFPVAKPQLASDSRSQTYSIAGGQNQANPYGVVPVLLGRNRRYPDLGAKSYTEIAGADQYLRMLLVVGYGPCDIDESTIKIGETAITDFSDYEIEVRNGYDTDDPVTLFPDQVFQTDLSVAITAAAGWQSRTTEDGIDEISIDFVAQGGIVRIDSNGDSQNYTVSLRAEYSPTGAGTWSLLGTLDLTGKSTDVVRASLRKTVTHGQYDVRVEKTSTDYSGDDHVQEDVTWTALRGFRNSPPITSSHPLALIALRIRATSQLNGTIDQLNCIATQKVLAFNGSTWVADTASRNPADLFRYVLQAPPPLNAQPQPDSRIDIETLEEWWSFCNANGFTFDMVRDFSASVYDTLTDIAAAGRAVQIFRDGKWSVAWESSDDPIVQHFTPRNSWGFSSQRTYAETPHALRVRFVNADNGYQQDERIVYDDGYNADGSDGLTAATLFEQIEFPGVTDPDTVWKFGRYHIAQARLRPEVYTFNTDFEHLVCTRGDRVRAVHDVTMWGLASGRVVSVADPLLTLDEPITMVSGHSYAIRFRLADGSSLLKTIQTVVGTQTTVTLTGGDLGLPAAGDLFLAGESSEESVVLRVRSITPADNLEATLTLVDDAPEILEADSGTIPTFESHVTVPPDLFNAAPINLAVNEGFQGTGDNVVTGAFFSWETSAGQDPVSFEAQFADEDGDGIYKPAGTAIAPTKYVFVTNYHGGNWAFRVRSIFADGTASAWAVLTSQPLGGGTIIPKQVGPGAVNLEGLANETRALLADFGLVIRDAIADIEDLKTGVVAQDFANYTDHQELISKLVSETTYLGQTLTAAYESAILVATGPDSALAESITTIYTALGGDSSGVNIRFSSDFTPDTGFDSRFGLEVYSNVGDVFRAAGLYADVKSTGAQLVLIGDQIKIGKSDGTLYSLFDEDGQIVNGTIAGPSGASFWNLSTGAFRVST